MSFRPLVFIKTLLALIRDKINTSDNIWILKYFFQISIMHCTGRYCICRILCYDINKITFPIFVPEI